MMFSSIALAAAATLPMALAQTETVLGVYMFHRHGDRTPKILPPANLTDLGYRQVYTSGQYYRDRYITANAPYRISGINEDLVLQSQLQVSAPIDTVLQNSATGFLQALYPPVGNGLDTETLANGSSVEAPLQGYQLIPLGVAESGTGSEDSTWLQGTSDCARAEISSNEYYTSAHYQQLLGQTKDFYQRLLPVIDGVFSADDATFENAYEIFDYINVAEIHNSTIPHSSLLTDATLQELLTLANTHEWNLAYNASTPIRAVTGMTLAAQIVQFLNGTLADAGSFGGQKLGIQFGAYGTFASFFGLAGLADVHDYGADFKTVTEYASSMVFEMFTNTSSDVTAQNYPSEEEVYVRFLYHNGTATQDSPPQVYPLFGQDKGVLGWQEFKDHMNSFALGDTGSWCHACGNTTGVCAAYVDQSESSSSSTGSTATTAGCSNGLSPAVNGVIGAMVTLAVVLGLEALIMVVCGLRVVSKKRLASGAGTNSPNGEGTKA